LRNTKASEIREAWIDAIFGHAGSEDDAGRGGVQDVGRTRGKSEGVVTYLHKIDVANLRLTVEAIQYAGVDFSRVGQ